MDLVIVQNEHNNYNYYCLLEESLVTKHKADEAGSSRSLGDMEGVRGIECCSKHIKHTDFVLLTGMKPDSILRAKLLCILNDFEVLNIR